MAPHSATTDQHQQPPTLDPRTRGEPKQLSGTRRMAWHPGRANPVRRGVCKGESPRPQPHRRPKRESTRWLRHWRPQINRHETYQNLSPWESAGQQLPNQPTEKEVLARQNVQTPPLPIRPQGEGSDQEMVAETMCTRTELLVERPALPVPTPNHQQQAKSKPWNWEPHQRAEEQGRQQ